MPTAPGRSADSSQTPPPISAARRAKVDAARKAWIRQLVDMSRRNNLLYYRDLKVGTLDLSTADPAAMLALLQSNRTGREGVRLTELVDATRKVQAAGALVEISRRARSNFEERGLDTLFLAMGLATWTAEDEGRDAAAPVLLVPLHATQTGGSSGPWSLRRAGDVKFNDVLLHALRQDHGVVLDSEALVAAVLGDDEGETFDLEPAFEVLRQRTLKVPGFSIAPRWVVGNFAFQKMAIVKDLNELPDALAAHDIVAAIARDSEAEQTARGNRTVVGAGEIDLQTPDQEFLIRDADSSQHQAIAATLRGENGVISGPPGTGKSQTISNLIAELVARGKTVLFVAEKRAALDVVLNRLKEADLDHLCLDCHGAELSRRHIAEQFAESLDRVRDAPMPDTAVLHKRFTERRDRLNRHVRALHSPRQPGGMTLYALYGRLLAHPVAAAGKVRLPKQVLDSLDESKMADAREQIRELAALSGLFTGDTSSPWAGARLTTTDDVRHSLERARRLSSDRWPRWQNALAALLAECPARPPRTVAEVRTLLEVQSSIQETLKSLKADVYREDLAHLANALAPAKSWFGAVVALIFNSEFRAALGKVRALSVAGKIPPAQALHLVIRAREQLAAWRGVAADQSTFPLTQPRLADAKAAWTAVLEDLEPLVKCFTQRSLEQMALADMDPWLSRLASDAVSPSQILKVHGIVSGLKAQGLDLVLQDLSSRKPDPALWPDILVHAWMSSCLEEIQLQDPEVAGFSGRRHDEIAEEFRRLDRERLGMAVQRVQREHALKALKVRNQHPEQNAVVTREAAKRTRHLPLRRLFVEAPDVVLALRPCWMASPLSVSQLIPGEAPLFDIVIFDEASQVLPEDAITSLLRGRQAVIAGDKKQLPPTTFFAAGESVGEEDEDAATGGFQSILDVMSSFLEPAWSLDWHYRSRDESLIAYSNHRIYDGRLVTFPGPGGAGAVRHELVAHVPGVGAQENSVAAEVQRVVELVRDHVRDTPGESLGVIAMGIEHAHRIEMALDRARQEDPSLEQLFAPDQRERFFVKNLERVQGDERDVIVLSTGYGKNDAGQMVYRFGPLLQEGGERRLNVAITRARRRMTVVSSFSHHDLQADYPKAGVRLLRGFLEFAASGGQRFERGTTSDVALNDFEQSVFDELTRCGLKLVRQVGSSRYRIDMVAMHPEQEGRFVLAIECDGASYHSAPTARDRDRLRQQQLEALGWSFHRIWSTDWFLRREEEVQRALQAFNSAVASGGVDASRNAPPPVPPPTVPAAAPRVRRARPPLDPGRDIGDYSSAELRAMVRWVLSDGTLPTDEEIVAELTRDLGFKRRGTKIVEALQQAIRMERG